MILINQSRISSVVAGRARRAMAPQRRYFRGGAKTRGAPKVKLKCAQKYISGKEHKGFSYFLLVSQPQIGYTTLSFVNYKSK